MMKINDSEHLRYVPVSFDDLELLNQLDSDAEVMKYINGGKPLTLSETMAEMFPIIMQQQQHSNGWGLWKIMLHQSTEFIGWILLRPMPLFYDEPQDHHLEIAIRLKQCAWGNGYATQAFKQVMVDAPAQADISQFTAGIMATNLACIQMIKNAGLQYVKSDTYLEPSINDGEKFEVVFYSKVVKSYPD